MYPHVQPPPRALAQRPAPTQSPSMIAHPRLGLHLTYEYELQPGPPTTTDHAPAAIAFAPSAIARAAHGEGPAAILKCCSILSRPAHQRRSSPAVFAGTRIAARLAEQSAMTQTNGARCEACQLGSFPAVRWKRSERDAPRRHAFDETASSALGPFVRAACCIPLHRQRARSARALRLARPARTTQPVTRPRPARRASLPRPSPRRSCGGRGGRARDALREGPRSGDARQAERAARGACAPRAETSSRAEARGDTVEPAGRRDASER